MLSLFSFVLLAAICGILSLISLVLIKGQICPGQRGRLHRSIGFIILPMTFCFFFTQTQVLMALSLVSLALFLRAQKKGKNAKSSHILLLHAATLFSFMSFSVLLISVNWQTQLLLISQLFLVGACGAHWILSKAGSRLQAFDRILPVVGILSAMMMTISLALSAQEPNLTANQHLISLLQSLALMLLGLLVWVYPALKNQKIAFWQLNLVLLTEIASSVLALNLSS